jgi:type VI secretion system protein ImpH
LNLDYPHSDIEGVNPLPGGKGYEIITTFFGLYGVASPLPGYYTEELLDEEWEEREAGRYFLDVIHQHLYPLLYKAWVKYRFSHNAIESDDERYWEIIYSILGLPEEFREFGDLSGQFIKYAGIISQRPKTQSGLNVILSDYLESIEVNIEPCVRRQVSIVEHQRCKLSSINNVLGVSSVIGKQICDRSGKYNLHIGPLTGEQFQALLTDRKHVKFIRTVSDLFLAQPLQCDIILHLDKDAVKPTCLGEPGYSSLGQSTWLVNQTNEQTFDVVLN